MEAGGDGHVLALLLLALQGAHGVVPDQQDLWRRAGVVGVSLLC